MIDATVTMPLHEFDYLRDRSKELDKLFNILKRCFVMESKEHYEEVDDVEMTNELKRYILELFEEDFKYSDKLIKVLCER